MPKRTILPGPRPEELRARHGRKRLEQPRVVDARDRDQLFRAESLPAHRRLAAEAFRPRLGRRAVTSSILGFVRTFFVMETPRPRGGADAPCPPHRAGKRNDPPEEKAPFALCLGPAWVGHRGFRAGEARPPQFHTEAVSL
jgi:hypothetical protein